jgi:MFS family permease
MNDKNDKILFWGCFLALIATAFGFITRMFLIGEWSTQFGLDAAQSGRLAGIGIWPFAASIIFFSLVIDKIGYKASMVIAFIGHITWAIMGVAAYFVGKGGDNQTAFQLLYWGSLVLALANGTVEAFINPVVATVFSGNKTKWLNILHAGWPGGLVLAGIIVIFMGTANWGLKVGIIAVPAVVYLVMLLPIKFPVQERVASGVSYRDMLAEFGILGAAIVGFLTTLQLIDFATVGGTVAISGGLKGFFIAIGVGMVVAFGLYTKSLGRPLMFILVLIMMPLATTEIGTDGWITSIMEGVTAGKFHPGWVLVYTSAIMMVLRFMAGPIIHALSPLGLLMACSVLAIIGLTLLAGATGIAFIFFAATLYAIGKTFFWPTMLGVVSEQTPRGGALTLNAIAGIGMLSVGTLGFPFIGALQAGKQINAVAASEEAKAVPGLVENGALTVTQDRAIYEVITYSAIDLDAFNAKVSALPEAKAKELGGQLAAIKAKASQGALKDMAMFPVIMLIAYIALFLYFKSRGGYKPVQLGAGGH